MKRVLGVFLLAAAGLAATSSPAMAQRGRGNVNQDSLRAHRWVIEKELESLAIIDRKVMIRMRDGTHIPADIYRPKDTSKKYAGIWVRTPYNFNYSGHQPRRAAGHDAGAHRHQARLRVHRHAGAWPLLCRRELRHPRARRSPTATTKSIT